MAPSSTPAESLLPALTTGLRGSAPAASFPHGYAVTLIATLAVTAAACALGAYIAGRAALLVIPLGLACWAHIGLDVTAAGIAPGHAHLTGSGIVLLAAVAAGLPLAAACWPHRPWPIGAGAPHDSPPPERPGSEEESMSRNALTAAVIAVLTAVVGTVSAAAASSPAGPSAAKSTTLVFEVVFSPHTVIEANTDNPEAPIALGDVAIFHDQLFSSGRHVGDTAGSCVVVGLAPHFPNNCSAVFQLPGGDITAQFVTAPGPGAKPIALTGGTATYRNIGGDGTLVEFGYSKGKLTLHILRLVARG